MMYAKRIVLVLKEIDDANYVYEVLPRCDKPNHGFHKSL